MLPFLFAKSRTRFLWNFSRNAPVFYGILAELHPFFRGTSRNREFQQNCTRFFREIAHAFYGKFCKNRKNMKIYMKTSPNFQKIAVLRGFHKTSFARDWRAFNLTSLPAPGASAFQNRPKTAPKPPQNRPGRIPKPPQNRPGGPGNLAAAAG